MLEQELKESIYLIYCRDRYTLLLNMVGRDVNSQLRTNSYNLDDAIALKEGFIIYILPHIRELVLASIV